MKILFAASEAAPFVKSGGLGDVAYALPQQLKKDGHDVRVVIPYYQSIKHNPAFSDVEFLTSFGMDLAWRRQHVGVFRATAGDVTYYLIDNEYYFARNSCYGFYDDGERFAYFSKAILEMLLHIDFFPDVLHLNDWQTALSPAFLHAHFWQIDRFRGIKTIFTIHNIEYQGKVANEFLSFVMGVDESMRPVMTYDDCINFMKSAIVLCDRVTTVSETYSYEIRYAYFSHGLDPILKQYEYKLSGIVNGIDTDLFNPEHDRQIFVPYKHGEIQKKRKNKRALQEELHLEVNDDIPMVAMISRLVSHKGLDLVEYVTNELMGMHMQLVVLGTGDRRYEDLFRYMAYSCPGKISANIRFDSVLASKIYAGADLFLMPSKSEPCGLSQLIAMRYGTIPIVRETGGLCDTVPPINTETLEGRGFTFKGYNAHDMLGAIERAIAFYYDKEKYPIAVDNIMQYNSSWEGPAKQYADLYQSVL